MRALILAAGLGTRLRPLTNYIPKPAVDFLNFPILAFPVFFSEFFPVQKLVVNTHHLPGKIRALFVERKLTNRAVIFSDEQPEILGSSGAIWNAQVELNDGDDLLVLNGDGTLVGFDPQELEQMYRLHKQERPLATLLVIENEDVGKKFGGIWVDGKDRVVGAGKQRPAQAVKGYHFVSVMLLSNRIFSLLPEGRSEIWDILNPEIAKGEKVLTHKISGTWLETGDPASFLSATKHCLNSVKTKSDPVLTALLAKHASSSQFIDDSRGQFLVDRSVSISDKSQIRGFGVFGKDVVIAENCQITDSVILESTHVPPGTALRNALHSKYLPT